MQVRTQRLYCVSRWKKVLLTAQCRSSVGSLYLRCRFAWLGEASLEKGIGYREGTPHKLGVKPKSVIRPTVHSIFFRPVYDISAYLPAFCPHPCLAVVRYAFASLVLQCRLVDDSCNVNFDVFFITPFFFRIFVNSRIVLYVMYCCRY